MPATRRSARLASSQSSSSPVKDDSPRAASGSKRKSETGSSPAPKRGKKDAPKEQKTIEDTMDIDQPEMSAPKAQSGKPETKTEQPSATQTEGESKTEASVAQDFRKNAVDQASEGPEDTQQQSNDHSKQETTKDSAQVNLTATQRNSQADDLSVDPKQNRSEKAEEPSKSPSQEASQQPPSDGGANQTAERVQEQTQEQDPPKTTTKETDTKAQQTSDKDSSGDGERPTTNGSAVVEHARDAETPSSILEKGIIYFFFRGRVGIDEPSNVQDIARSYFVLRPLPHGAKLGDGPIGASNNKCRLLALPKKVLPTSGKDRFMTFVEKTHTSFPELKKSFLPADDYETKTAGVRHTPPATPIAEGVYAITTTGRENHLAYMLTIPSSLGEVQQDMGLRDQGSFVVSCKNPQYPGPSYASLPQSPDFPKEILDEFRSLRWMPLQPKHLDYENTQFLLIGESSGIEKALDVPDAKKEPKEDDPKEEMERLEGEDEIRIKHLKGDDAIFADLGVSKKDYPQVPTTWDT